MYCYRIFLCILVCLVHLGRALDCYSCTTLKTDKCLDTFDRKLGETVKCDENQYGCMKQILPRNGSVPRIIHRGCAPTVYCQTLKSVSDFCSICTSQLCNSSTLTKPSIIVASVLLFSVWLTSK